MFNHLNTEQLKRKLEATKHNAKNHPFPCGREANKKLAAEIKAEIKKRAQSSAPNRR